MKIISWNCNGKFRTKFKEIEKEDADIYVIQECENPKFTKENEYKKFASNYIWIGETNNKGLGIFAKENIKLEKNNWEAYCLRNFLSVRINNEELVSAYHYYCNEEQGEETQKTFYLYKHLDKGYHIDHCFIKKDRIKKYQILFDEKWLKCSDHMPVILEIKKIKI